jgi:hypothetical protein
MKEGKNRHFLEKAKAFSSCDDYAAEALQR